MIEHSSSAVSDAIGGRLVTKVSDMLYDSIVTGLCSKGMEIDEVLRGILAIASIDHQSLPVTAAIAVNALILYDRHGGDRRLHYFDSYHVATARIGGLLRAYPYRRFLQSIFDVQSELYVFL